MPYSPKPVSQKLARASTGTMNKKPQLPSKQTRLVRVGNRKILPSSR